MTNTKPASPFVPLTIDKVMEDIAESERNIAEGKCRPMSDALTEMEKHYGFI